MCVMRWGPSTTNCTFRYVQTDRRKGYPAWRPSRSGGSIGRTEKLLDGVEVGGGEVVGEGDGDRVMGRILVGAHDVRQRQSGDLPDGPAGLGGRAEAVLEVGAHPCVG